MNAENLFIRKTNLYVFFFYLSYKFGSLHQCRFRIECGVSRIEPANDQYRTTQNADSTHNPTAISRFGRSDIFLGRDAEKRQQRPQTRSCCCRRRRRRRCHNMSMNTHEHEHARTHARSRLLPPHSTIAFAFRKAGQIDSNCGPNSSEIIAFAQKNCPHTKCGW